MGGSLFLIVDVKEMGRRGRGRRALLGSSWEEKQKKGLEHISRLLFVLWAEKKRPIKRFS